MSANNDETIKNTKTTSSVSDNASKNMMGKLMQSAAHMGAAAGVVGACVGGPLGAAAGAAVGAIVGVVGATGAMKRFGMFGTSSIALPRSQETSGKPSFSMSNSVTSVEQGHSD